MTLTVEPSGQACGATVRGVDLRRPIDDALAAELRDIWLRHQVIVLPEQDLSFDDLERVALTFGPFGYDPYLIGLAEHPHIVAVRREPDETTPIFAEGWHSDWSFLPSPPAATMLHSSVIPPTGGDTMYADQYGAYEALSDQMKARIATLTGIHSGKGGYTPQGSYGAKDVGRSMTIRWSDDAVATQSHPIARVHPETGRTALYVSRSSTYGIDSMEQAEADALLAELFEHQTQERFQYRHVWSEGMLAIWDNRCLLHRATGGYQGHRRLLHRITIAER